MRCTLTDLRHRHLKIRRDKTVTKEYELRTTVLRVCFLICQSAQLRVVYSESSDHGISRESTRIGKPQHRPQRRTGIGGAYEILRDEWRAGNREREVALHLIFLCWYLMVEPAFLTGLNEEEVIHDELQSLFNEIHDSLQLEQSQDAEALYVVGLMANLFPWELGEVGQWESRSLHYQARYRHLAPAGIDPNTFENRGMYGDYFKSHAELKDAY